MKRVAFIWTCTALLCAPSCNNSTSMKTDETEPARTELTDSLQTANAEKDSLLQLLNEISSGMTQIKEMESFLTADLSKETPDRKEQLRSDMRMIQNALLDRRHKLDSLEAKLRKSSSYNAEMKKTIASLRKQLETQEESIANLKEELRKAHVEIEDLNTRVDSLNSVNEAVTKEKVQAQEEAEMLANRLNTCYYVIGSKNELKKYNIIETGFLRKTKIMEGDYEKSYFTKADKRTLNEVNLNSTKAKVLSKHPAGSYSITDKNGSKVLVITSPDKFWELSNYLIVQTD